MSLSKNETILSGGEVVPQSRIEKILVGEDIEPQSRIEALLKEKLCGGGGGSVPAGGGATTLHINITAVNMETNEATFTADKTPAEMLQASANGPIWCVVTFAAGTMAEEAVSIGIPPAFTGVSIAFGQKIMKAHADGGNNQFAFAVKQAFGDKWDLDVTTFRGYI